MNYKRAAVIVLFMLFIWFSPMIAVGMFELPHFVESFQLLTSWAYVSDSPYMVTGTLLYGVLVYFWTK